MVVSISGMYCTILFGSKPHDAAIIAFGLASSILTASSLEAKPPNTTECIAPILAQASMAIIPSGTIGI